MKPAAAVKGAQRGGYFGRIPGNRSARWTGGGGGEIEESKVTGKFLALVTVQMVVSPSSRTGNTRSRQVWGRGRIKSRGLFRTFIHSFLGHC